MTHSDLAVPGDLVPRLAELAEARGRPVEALVEDILRSYLDEHEEQPPSQPGFDEVVFGEGEDGLRFSGTEFRQLPLRRQVHLLIGKQPRFFRGGEEIPRAQAMSLASVASS